MATSTASFGTGKREGHDASDFHRVRARDFANFGGVDEMFELPDSRLHQALVVLGRVVVGVFTKITVGTSFGNPVFDLPSPVGLEMFEFFLQFLQGRRCEEGGVVGHEQGRLTRARTCATLRLNLPGVTDIRLTGFSHGAG